MARKKAPLNPNDFFKTPRSGESVKSYLSKNPESINALHAWDESAVEAQNLKDEMARDANPDITIMQIPNDVLASSSSSTLDVGMTSSVAPTSNPTRPRAYAIAYNPNTKTVYIVFRSNAWWKYNDVSTDVWLGLAGSSSTNDYLPILEGACSSHGPANIVDMSAASWAQLSSLASSASRIQKR
jgi:KTSC domain